MMKIGVLCAAAMTAAVSGQVINGGFEQPGTGFQSVAPGQTFGNWTNAGPGDIEYVHATAHPSLPGLEFSAYEGSYWIDLVGVGAPSGIFQDIVTTPGTLYQVSFAYAGNVWGSPLVMTMNTLWNGQVTGTYSHLAQGSNGANMGWTVYSFTAMGTGLDRLTFQATSGANARGPAIDAVQIQVVPAPGAAAALALGGAIAARRRRR